MYKRQERDCSDLAALDPDHLAAGYRRLVERLAMTFQASLMVRYSPAPLAEAFIASRLDGAKGATFGTLDAGLVTSTAATAVDRASVAPA